MIIKSYFVIIRTKIAVYLRNTLLGRNIAAWRLMARGNEAIIEQSQLAY